jgi:hypothetical protein
MRLSPLLLIGVLVLLLSACKSERVIYNYLEDMSDTTTKKDFFVTEPVIQ